MRIHHAGMFVLPFICLVLSCKKNKDDPNKINLSDAPIYRWAGQDTTIRILPFSNLFTATSDNEEIAKVTVLDAGIRITTDLPGVTTIRVNDGQGRTAAVKVYAQTINGMWRRKDNDQLFKPQATVVADDAVFANELKTTLLAGVAIPPGNNSGEIFRPSPQPTYQEIRGNTPFREGSFSYRDLILKITVNGVEEIYTVKPVNLQLIGLEQDITAAQKALHPGKGISKVTVTRYFSLQVNPG